MQAVDVNSSSSYFFVRLTNSVRSLNWHCDIIVWELKLAGSKETELPC